MDYLEWFCIQFCIQLPLYLYTVAVIFVFSCRYIWAPRFRSFIVCGMLWVRSTLVQKISYNNILIFCIYCMRTPENNFRVWLGGSNGIVVFPLIHHCSVCTKRSCISVLMVTIFLRLYFGTAATEWYYLFIIF